MFLTSIGGDFCAPEVGTRVIDIRRKSASKLFGR